MVARNATNVRDDGLWGSDLQLWVDSVPIYQEHSNSLFSRMYRQFGITRPTGMAVYTWRNSTGKLVSIDDMELLLVTTPGTLIELRSGAWGTISGGPDTLYTYTGKLFPAGAVPERMV